MEDPHPQEDVAELWRDYKATGDQELRNRLVLQYSPLVKFVAGRVAAGLPASVDSTDLVSDGVIGLIDAIDKFQPERGLKFQTYAVPRIRGAIVDGLRAADWVPRSVRDKVKDVERAQLRLEARLSRTPTDEEIAEELGMPLAQLRDILGKASYANVMSLDELGGATDWAPTPVHHGPENDEVRARLLPAIRELPERDRIIVALYYFEGLTLAEIGHVLGVSESRVSQLHTRVTLALHAKLMLSDAA
jgi:RNA polymerase sigma factor for flagellar operon FliA